MPTSYPDPGPIADVIGSTGKAESTWANAVKSRAVQRFANPADRATAIPSPTEGMMAYIVSLHSLQMYNGTTWQQISGGDFQSLTSGDVTTASTTYVDVATATDLFVTARVNDRILFGISGQWSNEAVRGDMTVRSVTLAAELTTGAIGLFGVSGWNGINGQITPIGGSFIYRVVSGDLSSSVAQFRLRFKAASAVTKTLRGSTSLPLFWSAVNLGA